MKILLADRTHRNRTTPGRGTHVNSPSNEPLVCLTVFICIIADPLVYTPRIRTRASNSYNNRNADAPAAQSWYTASDPFTLLEPAPSLLPHLSNRTPRFHPSYPSRGADHPNASPPIKTISGRGRGLGGGSYLASRSGRGSGLIRSSQKEVDRLFQVSCPRRDVT